MYLLVILALLLLKKTVQDSFRTIRIWGVHNMKYYFDKFFSKSNKRLANLHTPADLSAEGQIKNTSHRI